MDAGRRRTGRDPGRGRLRRDLRGELDLGRVGGGLRPSRRIGVPWRRRPRWWRVRIRTRGPGDGPSRREGGRATGTLGKVTSISTDSITLTTMANKVVTVTVSASTVYNKGSTTSTSAALKVGDVAMVTGRTASNGTVSATVITFGTAPGGSRPGA
jgi:Domain of unknown function (DUF5666)